MINALTRLALGIAAAAAALALAPSVNGQLLLDEHPAETAGADIVDRRGEQTPLDAVFMDSRGEMVRFGDFFDGERPVVLVLGYYDCPLLCNLVFNASLKAFNGVDYKLGEHYRVVSVSFDHTNTPADAAAREAAMMAGYTGEASEGGWTFLTSDAANVRRLADAVGFKYVYLPKTDEYAHGAAIMLLTPQGRVSSYIFGLEYPPRQVKLGLIKASGGEIGSTFDKLFLHFCYVYDPEAGSFTLQAMRVMQLAAGLTVILLGGFISALFITSRVRTRSSVGSGEGSEDGPGR